MPKSGSRQSKRSSSEEIAEIEEIGVKIAKEALEYAMHAGRKTIKAEDIEVMAAKFLKISLPNFLSFLLTQAERFKEKIIFLLPFLLKFYYLFGKDCTPIYSEGNLQVNQASFLA